MTKTFFDCVHRVDLYGLVLFLGVDPYWVKHWWYQLLYRPYRRGNTEPLYNVIAQLLWRSAKKDVIDQVGLEKLNTEKMFKVFFVRYVDLLVAYWLKRQLVLTCHGLKTPQKD